MNYYYLKLEKEKSSKFVEVNMNFHRAMTSAISSFKDHCDYVLRSVSSWDGSTTFAMGFSERQEGPQWLNKIEKVEGYYVHRPRAGSVEKLALLDAERKVNSSNKFHDVLIEAYPCFSEHVTGEHIRGRGFAIHRVDFGIRDGVVFARMPFKDDFVIPKDWAEITLSEFNELNS